MLYVSRSALLVIAFVAVALVAVTTAKASAMTEYCGAHFYGAATAGNPNDYEFVAWSDKQQAISGKLYIKTEQGWYVAAIPSTPLQPTVSTWASNTHRTFRTDRMLVRFPAAAAPTWLVFAPDSGPMCPATDAKDLNPTVRFAWSPSPTENGTLRTISAVVTQPPGSTDCEVPFKDVTVVHPVPPQYPEALAEAHVGPATTLVEVPVGSDGIAQDAWLFSTSGYRQFDEEILKSARASTYAAGRSFCTASPGNYIFRGEFRPN